MSVGQTDVFSVTDFSRGLDTRRSPLTAPGGSLRILENAVINNGAEIEKRLAFVLMTTMPAGWLYLIGRADGLHAFSVGTAAPAIPPGITPVPIVPHHLEDPGGAPVTWLADIEPFGNSFYVCGASATRWYCWYNDVLVHEADGSLSSGSYARAWKSKMYRTDGPYLRFSGVNDPAQNDPASVSNPGAGFINLALNDPDIENLVSMEVYYSQMAVAARLQTQMWTLDPDPSKDTLSQLLRIGVAAPRSMVQFGTGDVLFLSDNGVRSLKALTVNLAASVSDVGSAIDPLLIEALRLNFGFTSWCDAIVEPIHGRYWLSYATNIYVLSYFPAGNITAWSTFDTGFYVKNFAMVTNRLYVNDSYGNVYLYGGLAGNEYDSSKVTVRTPHMASEKPTANKRVQSIDVIATGPWSVSVGMLPNNTEAFELCANITNNTLGAMSIPFAGYGTHIGVHLEHQAPGPATLSALYFNLQEGVTK